MLCGVTATLGSNPSATATAARPHWGRAVLLCLACMCGVLVAPLVFRVPEGPAAREARRPHVVRCRASKPARALRSLRRPPHRRCLVADMWLGASARCPASPRHRPLISHVIPLRLVQSLNLHRWNCNVFGVSRKMTTINYVRNLGGGGAWSLICGLARRLEARPGPAAAHGHRSRVPLLPVGVTGVSRVEFLGCSGACCYKRRQSEGFFAENGGFWA